jgi:hypothetical protein
MNLSLTAVRTFAVRQLDDHTRILRSYTVSNSVHITTRDAVFSNICKGFPSFHTNDIATLLTINTARTTSCTHPTLPVDIARITEFFQR